MASKKKCANCVYNANLSGMVCCDYLYKTGHRRPCPPGDECTVNNPRQRKKAKNSAIDGLA